MKNIFIKVIAGIAYVAMVAVNYLANALPIGGVTTGEASDAYGNLFTPAGITFSIWGLIYLLLLGYVVYQFLRKDERIETIIKKINPLFIATSVANIFWIFAWHYGVIWLSVIIMFVLLFFLIKIADVVNKEKYSLSETIFVRLPFSIYFGWITVATIANITVFLVSIGWGSWGIASFVWTSIILLVGAGIGILRMRKDNNIAYGLVLIWAYLGILYKHLSVEGFDGKYPIVIITVVVCLIFFTFFIGKKLIKKI